MCLGHDPVRGFFKRLTPAGLHTSADDVEAFDLCRSGVEVQTMTNKSNTSVRAVKPVTKLPKLSHTTFKPGRLAGTYRFKEFNPETQEVVLELDPTMSPQTISFPLDMCPEEWTRRVLNPQTFLRHGQQWDTNDLRNQYERDAYEEIENIAVQYYTASKALQSITLNPAAPDDREFDAARDKYVELLAMLEQRCEEFRRLTLSRDTVCYLSYNYDGTEYFYNTES